MFLKNYITENSILELKRNVKIIINIYKNIKGFKIYLQKDNLKIKYKNKNINLYLIENEEKFYWLIKLNNNTFIFILKTKSNDITKILNIIKYKI